MTKDFSRRAFLAGLAAISGTSVFAKAPATSLRPQARAGGTRRPSAPGADRIVRDAGLGGTVSYAVVDLRSGKVLEERKGGTAQPPASVAKSITALYALDSLGAGYRFKTRVMGTAPVQNGVLNGDLILVGGGDPTLNTDALASLAAKMKTAGLREVRGRFLVFGGALPFIKEIEPSQPDHVGYNPSVSGLNLNFNRVHFEWKRAGGGYALSMDARSEKYRPEVTVARISAKARSTPVYTYSDRNGHDVWTVASGALGKGGSRWLPVRKPEIYAGEVFQSFARSHGIRLKAPKAVKAVPEGRNIASIQSAPLKDILRGMLKFSTNLTAEVVGLTATVARTGKANSLSQSAGVMTAWAKKELGMSSIKLHDHSGLSDKSRMSARDMAHAMVVARPNSGIRPILKKIALRDKRRRVIKNHPINVFAKTGTLNFVSALSGYMVAKDGTELAFAIFAADTGRRSRIPKAQREAPEGAGQWNRRAKAMQQRLIERWGAVYSG